MRTPLWRARRFISSRIPAISRCERRLGFAAAKRWEVPRLALAVAATVVLVIGGSYAASRTEALDLRRAADVAIRPAEGEPGSGARLLRCDGGAGTTLQVNADKATVLLAHSGFERSAHSLAAPPEADCHFCHSL